MSGVENSAFELTEECNKKLEIKNGAENNFMTPVMIDDDGDKKFQEDEDKNTSMHLGLKIFIHLIVIVYFSCATFNYISTRGRCTQDCDLTLCSPFGMLLLLFGSTYLGLIYFKLVKPHYGDLIYESVIQPFNQLVKQSLREKFTKLIVGGLIVAVFFAYVIYETFDDFTRLRALLGIVIFIGVAYLISPNPKRIKWRPVICGAVLQFLLGVLFIRWPVGRNIFECFGNKVAQFLSYGKNGAAFVYSDYLVIEKGIFAFAVLPTIFFFSLCISVAYYVGAMQWVLFKLGWILQSILGTTVCESVNAAGNIFLGMSESPLVIKPFLSKLTKSEIHAIMTSGFATVSGSVMVAYIAFGAEPSHLITASVMAAPASLFFAKLIYPETEESQTSSNNIQLEKSSDSSLLDAASNGASQAIGLILNIIANLVAFVAFISFADGVIKWCTHLAGFEDVDIAFLLGKIFTPISWIIGVDWKDCDAVGNVIGTKTIVNEFVAFSVLGEYKKAGKISLRSSAIATFAICSFANPASVGIMIGGISSLAPERRSDVTKVAIRALFSACLVTLMTASIAGLLMTDEMVSGK